MIPTDEQLNKAMAEVCGWRWYVPVERPTPYHNWAMYLPPDANLDGLERIEEAELGNRERGMPRLTDYCTDRNTLPEVLATIAPDIKATFAMNLAMSVGHAGTGGFHGYVTDIIMACLGCDPRLYVVAALKALGKWQPDWDRYRQTEDETPPATPDHDPGEGGVPSGHPTEQTAEIA